MLKSLALVLSLLGNVGLLGLKLREDSVAVGPAPSADVSLTAASAPPPFRTDYRSLRALGLDDHAAKVLRFAQIEAQALRSVAKPSDRYWQTGHEAYADYAVAVGAAHAKTRSALEAEFGAAAAGTPEFARVYRPIDVQFAFLSSEQQIALHEWRLQKQRERARMAGRAPHVDVPPQRTAPAAPPEPDELSALRAILPADAAFEVAVRESPLADELRAAGVTFSEAEFRSAYSMLAEIAAKPLDASTQLAVRRRLRTLLGTDRYERVWSHRDAMAALVRRVGGELGLGEPAVAAAYGVLNDGQERLLELALESRDEQRTVSGAREIAANEQARLAAVVGEDAARTILTARAQYFMAVSRAPPRGAELATP